MTYKMKEPCNTYHFSALKVPTISHDSLQLCEEIVYQLQIQSQENNYCRIFVQGSVDNLQVQCGEGQPKRATQNTQNASCGALDCFSV